MRLIADENFPGEAVDALREEGHDVYWVHTECPGSRDQDILAHAQSEGRVVVTADKDFGELAFRFGLPASCGVILFRLRYESPEYVAKKALETLEAHPDWSGCFGVVEDARVRIHPIPGK